MMTTPKERPLYISLLSDIPYAYSAGRSLSRFLISLRDDAKIIASRCHACAQAYVPPRRFCLQCHREMPDYIEVGPGGRLETYSVINFSFIDPVTGKERPV